MKAVISLLLLAALAGGGAWYWRHNRSDAPAYLTTTVTRGDVTQVVTATGQLNPVLNVQVGSQISGRISSLKADWNSPVKAGEIVAQIDPAPFQASVLEAEGDLESAKAALELAQTVARRAADLRSHEGTSQAVLDQALASLHQAEASIKIKQGALDKTKVDLEHCTIYSPIDGMVISRNVDVGQTVAASLSAPVIFTIANDLSNMQIDSNVAEADVGNVAEGQNVDFFVDAYPYRTFHGKVRQVRNSPTTVQNVVTYDVVISVKNADLKLKPGMTANISVIIDHREGALKLANAGLRFRPLERIVEKGTPPPTPFSAERTRPGGNKGERRFERTVYLWAGGEDKPRKTQIKVGISDGIATEVLSGLKEGDQVITASTDYVSDQVTNPFSSGKRF